MVGSLLLVYKRIFSDGIFDCKISSLTQVVVLYLDKQLEIDKLGNGIRHRIGWKRVLDVHDGTSYVNNNGWHTQSVCSMRMFEFFGVYKHEFADLDSISYRSKHKRMQNEGAEKDTKLR